MSSPTETPDALINGNPGTHVDAGDRGFTLGDGLFETIAIRGGRPRFWRAHYERLQKGCQRLALPTPDAETLHDEIERVCGGRASGMVRLTLSRGVGPRGYAPPDDPSPTRVVAFHPGGPPAERPLTLRWCDMRLGLQPELAGLKHLNRLEQVLARSEWQDPGIDEGIMQSVDGRVIECVTANIFLVREGELVTPALSDCGVAGVVRAKVLEAAADLGVETDVRDIGPGEVATADELFITNSSRGVAAVGILGDRAFTAPGRLTRQLGGQIDWQT